MKKALPILIFLLYFTISSKAQNTSILQKSPTNYTTTPIKKSIEKSFLVTRTEEKEVCSLDFKLESGGSTSNPIFSYSQEIVHLDVFNGVLPYTYEWYLYSDSDFRRELLNMGDNTPHPDGAIEWKLFFNLGTEWSAIITDATGCQISINYTGECNDCFWDPCTPYIFDKVIIPDNCLTEGTYEGSITLSTMGGPPPPYAYKWEGPATWSSTAQTFPFGSGTPLSQTSGETMTIDNLPYGWYAVTISNSGDDYCSDITKESWYWVPCANLDGRGKGELVEEQAILEVYNNGFSKQIGLNFGMPDAGRASVSLYNLAGKKLLNLFNGQLEGGIKHQMEFDVNPLSGGSYIVVLETDKGTILPQKVLLVD